MELVQLNKVCEIKNGFAFKSTEYKNEGIPLLRISNFDNGDVFTDDKQIYVDNLFLDKKSDFIVEKGDVLIALSGATTGKYGVYNFNYPSLLNQRIGLIKTGVSDKLDSRYFYYYLNILKKEILRNAGGAAQPNISTKKIGEFKIPLPPLADQKRIATILDQSAALRDKTKTILSEYDRLAQSIFLDMFGDPVTNPKGWDLIKLGEITNMKAGKFVSAKEIYSESDVNLYSCYGGNGLRGFVKSHTHKGDFVLIGRQGALCGNVKKVNGVFHATEHAIVCSPNMKYKSIWLYFLLDIINLNKYATGAAQPGLNVGNLVKLEMIFPPIEFQNQFAEKIANIEQQKALAQQELEHSENLFNGLLQKAFKGAL